MNKCLKIYKISLYICSLLCFNKNKEVLQTYSAPGEYDDDLIIKYISVNDKNCFIHILYPNSGFDRDQVD